MTKPNKLSDVKVDASRLIAKVPGAEDVVDKDIIVHMVSAVSGDYGDYLQVTYDEVGGQENQMFQTGAQNVVVKLQAAQKQGLLPLSCKVVRVGKRMFDLE